MPRGNQENSQTTKATLGLRELLLSGAFKPRERVPELRLVEELGVSRTPLRIALVTLEHEGLLETLPGGGFVVREFTRTDIDDAIELRGVLEGTAARFAAERLDSEDELEPLREVCDELDLVVRNPSMETFIEYHRLNEEFHQALRDLAKSPQLERELEHVLALPFGPPSALLMVGTRRCRSRGRSCSSPSISTRRSSMRSVGARAGARTRSPASTHASRARTSTSRSRTGNCWSGCPGRRCCASRPLSLERAEQPGGGRQADARATTWTASTHPAARVRDGSRPRRPERRVRRCRPRADEVPSRTRLRMGRRARRRGRRVGVRGAVGVLRRSRPTLRRTEPLGSRHRQQAAPARPRRVRPLVHPAGRAVHLRRKPQTSRPVPEARLLARCADPRGGQVTGPPARDRASSRSSHTRRTRSSTSFSTRSER